MIHMRPACTICRCKSPTRPPWTGCAQATADEDQSGGSAPGRSTRPSTKRGFLATRRIRLEAMNFLGAAVRKVWNELEGFANPLDRLMRKHRKPGRS